MAVVTTHDGSRVDVRCERWSSREAIGNAINSKEDAAFYGLVISSGFAETAKLLGCAETAVRARWDAVRERVAIARGIAVADLPILDLIDELGVPIKTVARILKMDVRKVASRYWRARQQLQTTRHDEELCQKIPRLTQRDFIAFELVHVLGYSQANAGRALGVNPQHITRRIELVQRLLREHLRAA